MNTKKVAVLYCRVSTQLQSTQGNSLEDQETEGRKFAGNNGYDIAKVFIERGESAKTADRPQLQAMLQYIAANKGFVQAVITMATDRISRDTYDYFLIDKQLNNDGVEILTIQETNDRTAAGKFARNISVCKSKYDNDRKAEYMATANRNAIARGEWILRLPVGYRRALQEHGKRHTVIDEKKAPFIREIFELLSTGEYSQSDVRRILENKGFRIKNQAFNKLIRNPFYAGLLRSKYVSGLVPGIHPPLISLELFDKVQTVTRRQERAPSRKPNNPDFPLRGHVRCPRCKKKLTAAPSKGSKGKHYAYYRCVDNHCISIKKENLENSFRDLLSRFSLRDGELTLFKLLVEEEWNESVRLDKDRMVLLSKEIEGIKERRNTLQEKLISQVISDEDYSFHNKRLSEELREKEQEAADLSHRLDNDFETVSQNAYQLIRQLDQGWNIMSYDNKTQLIRALFNDTLHFDGKEFMLPYSSALIFMKNITNIRCFKPMDFDKHPGSKNTDSEAS